MPTNLNKLSLGYSGEYLVAAELEKRGFAVAFPRANTKDIDLLAYNSSTHKSWAIQVKTTSWKKNHWMLSKKSEELEGDNLLYVFVRLDADGKPLFFIVPSAVVAEFARRTYKAWLSSPGRNGQPHQPTTVRGFDDPNGDYLDRWDLLS